jgi:RNA polymerase sigma factor (TIGR02999 family)
MPDVTQLLEAANAGDRQAAAHLLPLVYDELRKLATAKMAQEKPGHTLDATALVHEAYLRLLGEQQFDGRSHFFRVAAVAMRRILVDHARAGKAEKRGGGKRVDVDVERFAHPEPDPELEAIDGALNRLAQVQPLIAELVQLRYFAGLTIPDAAALLGISPRTADAWWAYARGWMAEELKKS